MIRSDNEVYESEIRSQLGLREDNVKLIDIISELLDDNEICYEVNNKFDLGGSPDSSEVFKFIESKFTEQLKEVESKYQGGIK